MPEPTDRQPEARKVGCEDAEGLIRVHPETETCEVCAPALIKENRRLRAALGAAEERSRKLEEQLAALSSRVRSAVPYVRATLYTARQRPTQPEWGEVHQGRAHSSMNQLEGLKKLAASLSPDTST